MRLGPQVARAHYGHGYDDAARVVLHDEVVRESTGRGKRVLEIGLGSGYVTRALRRAGLAVTALDIAGDLGPEVRGSVTQLPFRRRAFDVVVAEEVLEHVPWEAARRALAELARVATRRVVLSVPQFGLATRLKVRLTREEHGLRGGQHYWTLGSNEVTPRDLHRAVEKAGLRVQKDLGVYPLRPVPFGRGALPRAWRTSGVLRATSAWRLLVAEPTGGGGGSPR